MKWSYFLKVLGISFLLVCCSNSPRQKPSHNIRNLSNDPQGMFIQIMNYMLPMEIDGITMKKVSAEGTNGVVFPMVGDIPIPDDLDEMQTKMFSKMFSGMARDQVCNQGVEPMFKAGLYVKFIFRDEKSNNQVEVIVDEKTCNTDKASSKRKSPHSVPGIIQAEDFNDMSGVEIEDRTKSDGGANIGYIDAGDWVEFSLDVPKDGTYVVEYRVSSLGGSSGFDVLIDSTKVDSLAVENTDGWQSYVTKYRTLQLTEGENILRLNATGGGWNLNWIYIDTE